MNRAESIADSVSHLYCKWAAWPTFQIYLSYKSICFASAGLQPAEGEPGSLTAWQSGSAVLVQGMSCPLPPISKRVRFTFFQTLWAEAVSLTDSLSACSRQSFDTPRYSFSQVSYSSAEPSKREKAWSNHILFRNCSCRTHQIIDVSNLQIQLLKW